MHLQIYTIFFNGRKRRIREGGAVSEGGNLLILHDRTVWGRIWAIERPGNKVSLYFFFLRCLLNANAGFEKTMLEFNVFGCKMFFQCELFNFPYI